MPPRKKSVAGSASSQAQVVKSRPVRESAKLANDKNLQLQQKEEMTIAKRTRNVAGPSKPRGRKRKTDTPDANTNKKLRSYKKGYKGNKTCCWICHEPAQGQTCACKRVYHDECLVKTSQIFNNDKCPECQIQSINGTQLTRPFIDGLKVYLEFATKFLTEERNKEMFSLALNSDIIPSIDVETVIEKVQSDSYKTTAECYADVLWFYHDCCVVYGEHSSRSRAMEKVIKQFKEELFDMEACPECYYHFYLRKSEDTDDNIFVRLCNPPHDIVWARVNGYSHFPAKCLKIINGKARVRFFGKHEKSDIPVAKMFCMSLHHPKYKKRNIIDAVPGTSLDYFYARQQFLEYKTLYDEVIGDFQFFDYRVTYEPGSVVSETTNRTGDPALDAPTLPPVPTVASTTMSSPPTGFEPSETDIPSADSGMPINLTFSDDTHTTDSGASAFGPATHIQEGNPAIRNISSRSPSLPGHTTDSGASAFVPATHIQEENPANISSRSPSLPGPSSYPDTDSPVSASGSFVTIDSSADSANPHGFRIKQESGLEDQIPDRILRQVLEDNLRSLSSSSAIPWREVPMGVLVKLISRVHQTNPQSVPGSANVKSENDPPSTSQGNRQIRESQVVSSSSHPGTLVREVIDLTKEEDELMRESLLNEMKEEFTQVVDNLASQMCDKFLKMHQEKINQEEINKKK